MESDTSHNKQYFPQFDALRFFAVLAVMIAHNWHPRRLPWLLGEMDLAGPGVRLFFVLSGFLITGILLDCRKMAEKSSQSSWFFVRQFYARRFLRIFPIYYLVILIAILVNLSPAREIWIWLMTYTSNVYITLFETSIGRFGHFWTLAVEEQFYFFWPWLVLFAPKKWLIPSLVIATLLAPTYRFFIAALSWHFFELPINKLKRFFPYVSKRTISSPGFELVEGESQAR